MSNRLPAQAFRGIEYVRRYYRVPARRGGRVRYEAGGGEVRFGTITSAPAPHLCVRFDGDRHPLRVHPTDVEYLEVTA